MKYFLDTEFIEGFHNPIFGKRRHFIDLISIGIVSEDGREYKAISNEYSYRDADPWVKENVIWKLYTSPIEGNPRKHYKVANFHKVYGKSNRQIMEDVAKFMGAWRDVHFWRAGNDIPEVYAYFADYDWVLFCSLFGRMIDLPKGWPMYCKDLKQMQDEKALSFKSYTEDLNDSAKLEAIKDFTNYPVQKDNHLAIDDARWNKKLYEFLQTI